MQTSGGLIVGPHLHVDMHEHMHAQLMTQVSSFFCSPNSHRCTCSVMLKRARLQAQAGHWDEVEQVDPNLEILKQECGAELFQHLCAKVSSGEFSAYDVCVLAHYVSGCGGVGVESLALDPGSAKKNASRVIRDVLKRNFVTPLLFRFLVS